jgi:hypothetical protein
MLQVVSNVNIINTCALRCQGGAPPLPRHLGRHLPPPSSVCFSSSKIKVQFFIDPYVLTNNFAQDFHELAKRAGFPELCVVPRPCLPKSKKINSAGLENAQPPGKGDKKDGELNIFWSGFDSPYCTLMHPTLFFTLSILSDNFTYQGEGAAI